ncbi:MAG TPA: hypothetical protein VL325_05440 [Pyrinomonadaceae bacterium]|nr:hypothetical protein [Pyrinomonadaceae bacterium]
MNKEIIKNEERDELGEMLRGLKRIEAPANFDFGLRSKIANGKPAARNTGISRLIRHAVPAALVLVIGVVLVLNSLYFVGERDVADIPPVTEAKTVAPPQAKPQSKTVLPPEQTIAAVDPDAAGPQPLVKTRPKAGGNKPRKASNETPGGSYDAARRLQEPIYPKGLNPNGGNEIGVKDVFGFLGIDAAFDGKNWIVKAIKEKSIADRIGIKPGDQPESIDGRPISETSKFKTPFSAKNLTVIRDGMPVNILFH